MLTLFAGISSCTETSQTIPSTSQEFALAEDSDALAQYEEIRSIFKRYFYREVTETELAALSFEYSAVSIDPHSEIFSEEMICEAHSLESQSPYGIAREEVAYEFKGNGYGYIRVSGFKMETTPNNFRNAVSAMIAENNSKSLSGLILDLRNNRGGDLHIVVEVIREMLGSQRYFINGSYDRRAAQMFTIIRRGRISDSYRAYTREPAVENNVPILILVNSVTGSAAELLTGVLQAHGRALVAGTSRTYGKGVIQDYFKLETGGCLRLTTGHYLVGSEGCEQAVQRIGIHPDIRLIPDIARFPGPYEEDLKNAPETISLPTPHCGYHFEVLPEHWEAVYEMLRILGLTPVIEE